MGYARIDNISRVMNRMLHAGPVSFKEMVDELIRRGEKFHSSGMAPDGDRNMLEWGAEEIINRLQSHGCVRPAALTERQRRLLARLEKEEMMCGFLEDAAAWKVFTGIRWQAAKKRLPVEQDLVC